MWRTKNWNWTKQRGFWILLQHRDSKSQHRRYGPQNRTPWHTESSDLGLPCLHQSHTGHHTLHNSCLGVFQSMPVDLVASSMILADLGGVWGAGRGRVTHIFVRQTGWFLVHVGHMSWKTLTLITPNFAMFPYGNHNSFHMGSHMCNFSAFLARPLLRHKYASVHLSWQPYQLCWPLYLLGSKVSHLNKSYCISVMHVVM